MSNNVPKLSKNQSQPHASSPTLISHNTSLQIQHHPSLEANKDKEPMPNIKDIQPHSASAQAGHKKLAFLLDPHKDFHASVSPTHTAHTSPKSFLGSPIKSSKVKVSGSSLETSGVNLISPKDLVRLAMSKHKPKASVKKVTVQAATSVPKNMRKSLSLRFGPGVMRPDKHNDHSTSKIASNSIIEENSSISKTSLPNYQDKSAKLKRMKLIYSDIAQSEANRLTKSTIYTPHEVSGRMFQGTLSPNRSNSGLLWPGSPNSALNNSIKNQFFVSQGSEKQFLGKSSEEDSKEEKSYIKRASVEQIGSYLKEAKPLVKQGKRQEKKNAQTRAMTSKDNIKVTSASFSRVMSNHTVNPEGVDRAKSPIEGAKSEEETEMDETIEILNGNEQGKGKEIKPRGEFIADLKSWVNDIVKPQDENQILSAVAPPSKNSAAQEKVKEAQEGLLEKLRGALENDEFVRREDYERLYRERDSIEDELDAVKEENAQLRMLLWKVQEDNEAREIRDMEEKKATAEAISNYDAQVQEAMAKQHYELERLRKRENVVKDLLKMVWKAGIQIGDLQEDYDMMAKENVEFDEEQYYQHQQQMEHMQLIQNNQHMQYGEEPYLMNGKSYYTTSAKQDQIKQKYEHHLQPIGEDDSYQNGIAEQKEEFESESSSRRVIALSELGDSEPAFSTRRQQQIEMIAKANPQGLASTVLKESSNSNNNPNALNSKSTSDSIPKFSAKLSPQSCFPAKTQGNMKLDLAGIGGNQVPNTLTFLSQSSTEKIGHYVGTNPGTVQSLGFHEEFMSKLEEFSLSWRQDALNHQKF